MMQPRKLDPDEGPTGMHEIQVLGEGGAVLARYECICEWCDIWRAARPMLERAVRQMDAMISEACKREE